MQSEVGGVEKGAAIQTDGTLLLIKGLTLTLHVNDPHDDLELRAAFEDDEQWKKE